MGYFTAFFNLFTTQEGLSCMELVMELNLNIGYDSVMVPWIMVGTYLSCPFHRLL